MAAGTCAPRDETTELKLKLDERGLMPAIAVDEDSGAVLMLAYMNEDALQRTIDTGRVHYWSRSRQALWAKGETSGHTQELVSLQIDCDQDTLLVTVRQSGPACHTGRATCFYRRVEASPDGSLALVFDEQEANQH